jgi:hypothetical protein
VFDEKHWNYRTVVRVRNSLRENINEGLHIQLHGATSDSVRAFESDERFLGEVKVLWKTCLQAPLKWEINHLFPLANVSY